MCMTRFEQYSNNIGDIFLRPAFILFSRFKSLERFQIFKIHMQRLKKYFQWRDKMV